MNDKQHEALSAFFDGELNDPEMLESLLRSNGCKQAFSALCQQRAAMQGQLNEHLPIDFSEQVAVAIANEPTILSPAAAKSCSIRQVVGDAQSKVSQGRFNRRVPVAAVAASVAALGFVGLVTFNQASSTSDQLLSVSNNGANVAVRAPALASSAPILSVREDAVRPVTSDVRSIDFNSLSPQLRAQLLSHMEAVQVSRVTTGSTRQSNTVSFKAQN